MNPALANLQDLLLERMLDDLEREQIQQVERPRFPRRPVSERDDTPIARRPLTRSIVLSQKEA